MIQVVATLPNPDAIVRWLESTIRPCLTPDVSNYAKGRLRCWLGTEPTLTKPARLLPGTEVDPRVLNRLAELISWPFDFCLATYSGDEIGVGIKPHRDAYFARHEARSLHLSGECLWSYWRDRGGIELPHDELLLEPGQVIAFDCKRLHAAAPGPKRWNLNFWRRKMDGTEYADAKPMW